MCLFITPLESLLLLCAEQKERTEPFDVEEVVQEMPREQRLALWARLAALLQEGPPEQWARGGEERTDVGAAGDPVGSAGC